MSYELNQVRRVNTDVQNLPEYRQSSYELGDRLGNYEIDFRNLDSSEQHPLHRDWKGPIDFGILSDDVYNGMKEDYFIALISMGLLGVYPK